MLSIFQVSDFPKPLSTIVQPVKKETNPQSPPYILPPKEYIVVKNDSLTKIAKSQETTVTRLWEKNTGLTDPNNLKPGDKLIIPTAIEPLNARALPTTAAVPRTSPPAPVAKPVKSAAVAPRGVVPGNTYARGHCTWHAKNMRRDLPNNLGNANTWVARATAQGIPTGSSPRVGAIGMTKAYMHVVYITAVNGSKVTVSEMNYRGSPGGGFGKVSHRTTNASEFLYIY